MADDTPVVLETEGLTVRFGAVRAVDDLSIRVRAGRLMGLIGPNGAGKTTTLDALCGFVPHAGVVRFAGEDVTNLAAHERARRGLVRTWQSLELFDDLTLAENCRAAATRQGVGTLLRDVVGPGRDRDLDDVRWSLDLLGLTADADRAPSELSLGKRKLAGVARALSARPRLVALDEPAAGLDTHESAVLGVRLRDVVAHGVTVLLVDHDMSLVMRVCDEVAVIEFGKLIACGTPEEIRQDPQVIEAYLGAAHARPGAGEP